MTIYMIKGRIEKKTKDLRPELRLTLVTFEKGGCKISKTKK